MQIFAYPRVSTDEQAEQGNSLTEQVDRIAAYCRAMGWPEPKWYIEDGYSAKDMRRPRLTELLNDVKNSPTEGIVITTKLDRLSRNLFDILSLIKYLDKYDFRYVSSTEAFDTSTAAGRLTLQVLGMVAEFERERNSERVRENMLSLASKLKTNKVITRPCYGYDVIDGNYQVNIEEAVILRQAADIAESGSGARAIAKWLNNELKVTTKDGNPWHEKIVRELLLRETLVGDFVYNKTYRKGNRQIKRPEKEWIIIRDHHDPILRREQQERIRELFEGRKTIGRYISEDRYLLSGLVYCGHCGAKMNGKLNRSFSKRLNQENLHYRYMCDGYLKKANCYYHTVNRDDLEGLIIKRIHEVANAVPGTLQLVISKPKTPPAAIEDIESRLEKLDRKLQKQIEAFEDDLISKEDLRRAKQRVEEERKRLVLALEEAQGGRDYTEQRKVQENAKKLLTDVSSIDRLKAKHAIRQIIDRIEIKNGEDIELTWRFPN